jgi:pyrroloquinoline quinone biosynthesis protein B
MKHLFFIPIFFVLTSCLSNEKTIELAELEPSIDKIEETSIVILGNIQDAGSPHIGCKKDCCKELFESITDRRVVALGVYDAELERRYLFEATPDITSQIKSLKEFGLPTEKELPDGIFLTHAHIGHYTGLMYLGKEAVNANKVPVYAMPRMVEYLQKNGPWSQLVSLQNIEIFPINNGQAEILSSQLRVIPFLVPHRDEYSETVGYKIIGPNKSALFIPDIDKWEKWEKNIVEEIKSVDYAFLDATFYSGEEINNRDITQIPHPFVIESFDTFENLPLSEKNKVYFIHFNHTNPIIRANSEEAKEVTSRGFNIARLGDVFKL